MKESDVNRLIREEVDEIENDNQKQFIKNILTFERRNMDLDQPHYKEDFRGFVEDWAPEKSDDHKGDD